MNRLVGIFRMLFILVVGAMHGPVNSQEPEQQRKLRAKRELENRVALELIESGRASEVVPRTLEFLKPYDLAQRWEIIKTDTSVPSRKRFELLQFYWSRCDQFYHQHVAMGEDYFQLLRDLEIPSDQALVTPDTIGLFAQFEHGSKEQTPINFSEALVILRERPNDCGVLFALGKMVSHYNVYRHSYSKEQHLQVPDIEQLIAVCKTPLAKLKLDRILETSGLSRDLKLNLINDALPYLLNDEERARMLWDLHPVDNAAIGSRHGFSAAIRLRSTVV